MGDHWNGDGYGERMGGSSESDEQVRGRATGEDEFEDVTEDQDDDEPEIDDEEDSTL
jgi:hypothetical protein